LSDAVQLEQNETVKAGREPSQAAMSSDQKYVPGTSRPAEDELYGFRTAMAEAAREEEEARPRRSPINVLMLAAIALAVLGVAVLLAVGAAMFFKARTPILYKDLGTQRYDPAGLGGRLIVQWNGSAGYKFTIDPLDPAEAPGFEATISNPPHAITFTLRLKNTSDQVACQKDIVIQGAPLGPGGFDDSQALAPRTTPTGDGMQNVAGSSGQIGEMVLTGSLPCNLDTYKSIAGWEFVTDFPPLYTQKDWEQHEDAVQARARKGKAGADSAPQAIGGYFFVKSLPTPMEADDVIVSDNPSKGIVVTSAGRAFLVGSKVLVNPALDWQIFPADIHYRCERNAMCLVTRLSSRSAVRAHLMK